MSYSFVSLLSWYSIAHYRTSNWLFLIKQNTVTVSAASVTWQLDEYFTAVTAYILSVLGDIAGK